MTWTPQQLDKLRSAAYQEGFRVGYAAGSYDGGEHDCRMSPPTVDGAWQRHVFQVTGLTLDEQAVRKLVLK